MIHIDEIWLSREPLDMRSGAEKTLGRVVCSFGEAKPHCAYVFLNKRANRLKVLVCDGLGIWLASRRLHEGKFVFNALRSDRGTELQASQLEALVMGLPWRYAGLDYTIKHVQFPPSLVWLVYTAKGRSLNRAESLIVSDVDSPFSTADLTTLSPEALRTQVRQLQQELAARNEALSDYAKVVKEKEARIRHYQIVEEKLIHELAILRRYRYGRRSERLDGHQVSLLEEQIDEDIAALEAEVEKLATQTGPKTEKVKPKRQPLPGHLPRKVIHHEPDSTIC